MPKVAVHWGALGGLTQVGSNDSCTGVTVTLVVNELGHVTQKQELGRLLASIDPQLQAGVYVFCALGPGEIPVGLDLRMLFHEREATTVVVPLVEARAKGLTGDYTCEWITLGVSSDLAAVGFLAAVTTSLAAAGISANAVSAYHHDHLFVPAGRGEHAVALLRELQGRHQLSPG